MTVRITRRSLSDGRSISYFDGPDAPAREAVDRRGLVAARRSSEVRVDRLHDESVVVAPSRQGRTHLPAADDCPLCPTTAQRATEIPEPDFEVVVFDNRFPSFPGCEVVCFTNRHDVSFADLSVDRVRLVIEAWRDRTALLSAAPDTRQVFVFENRGEAIGVTLSHPHGQIYPYPFVPPRTARATRIARAHRERTGGDLAGDELATEAGGQRIVAGSVHWWSFVPFAARWPIEVHLYPRRRVADLTELTSDECDDLAICYLDLVRRMDAFYGFPLPYIAAWHQAPVRAEDGRDLVPLHLELFSVQRDVDKLKVLAGSESAMSAFVNDRDPEATAARLREVGR